MRRRLNYTPTYNCCKECDSEKRNKIREETGHDCHMTCESYLAWKKDMEIIKDNKDDFYEIKNARDYIGRVHRERRRRK